MISLDPTDKKQLLIAQLFVCFYSYVLADIVKTNK